MVRDKARHGFPLHSRGNGITARGGLTCLFSASQRCEPVVLRERAYRHTETETSFKTKTSLSKTKVNGSPRAGQKTE